MRGVRISIVAIMMAASASALAHPPPLPRESEPPHRTADIGWMFGALFAGGYAGLSTGPAATAWVRRGSMRYGVEGALARVWLTMLDGTPLAAAIPGTFARAGADARWTFASTGGSDLSFDYWLEVGAGVHTVQWDAGGRMVRTDGQLGIGLTERFGRRHRYGVDISLLYGVGRGGSGGVPTCAGPCDEPTAPVRVDFLLVEHVGFMADW